MSEPVEYVLNRASAAQIAGHLSDCDADFVPPLSARVVISEYASKIASKAMRFEAWSGGRMVGLVAAYCNDQESHIAYITSVGVVKDWMGRGIAVHLMRLCIEHAKNSDMRQVGLEVANENVPAIRLYEKFGFVAGIRKGAFIAMSLRF